MTGSEKKLRDAYAEYLKRQPESDNILWYEEWREIYARDVLKEEIQSA